jgi:hypothetical protein
MVVDFLFCSLCLFLQENLLFIFNKSLIHKSSWYSLQLDVQEFHQNLESKVTQYSVKFTFHLLINDELFSLHQDLVRKLSTLSLIKQNDVSYETLSNFSLPFSSGFNTTLSPLVRALACSTVSMDRSVSNSR